MGPESWDHLSLAFVEIAAHLLRDLLLLKISGSSPHQLLSCYWNRSVLRTVKKEGISPCCRVLHGRRDSAVIQGFCRKVYHFPLLEVCRTEC